MSTATISTKAFDGGRWFVQATVVLPDGMRCGAHCVEFLPEDATDDDLAAAVLAQYEPPAPAKKAAKK